ncbi:MAG: hypothetical protein U9R73_01415 [Pseudomonadota bacterium]|nr:hypothetical protein [Pseudomonadota bacterium]
MKIVVHNTEPVNAYAPIVDELIFHANDKLGDADAAIALTLAAARILQRELPPIAVAAVMSRTLSQALEHMQQPTVN